MARRDADSGNNPARATSVCPFCSAMITSPELQRHANNHFEDEGTARDMELAQHIALADSNSPMQASSRSSALTEYEFQDLQLTRDLELAQQLAFAPPSPPPANTKAWTSMPSTSRKFSSNNITSSNHGQVNNDRDIDIDMRVYQVTSLQFRGEFHQVKDGLMALLRNCLETENDNSTSILSGYVDHYQSIGSEDKGWGCGWRNIQMLSSHLLKQRKEGKSVLFGGCGYVPNIASLQRWLDIAWERGFDTLGSEQFDNRIIGSRKWIGTTECATLFRSFGMRARIVDFGPKEYESLFLSVPGSSRILETEMHNRGKRKRVKVNGPMDKFVERRCEQAHQKSISRNEYISNSNTRDLDGLEDKNKIDSGQMKSKGHQVLFDWIWDYFAKDMPAKPSSQRVAISGRMPLYFQHDGHSRTIVGVEITRQHNGTQNCHLLILDPSHRTEALERSLKANVGWKKLVKRGVHTLKKPQYQLCYVDPGIAFGEELEQLKVLDSIFIDL